jgi:dihydrofolate reductase
MTNIVYIATSLDGYIADKNGSLDWLQSIPNPDNLDFGWGEFMGQVDALIMGRNTFATVCGFDGEWPYPVPVFVLSNSMTSIADKYKDKAEIVSGPLAKIVESLNDRGLSNLYIDGGKTIQSFLQADLIDELTITHIPILLGGGTPLFGSLVKSLAFEHINTQVHLNAMVQSTYRRKA